MIASLRSQTCGSELIETVEEALWFTQLFETHSEGKVWIRLTHVIYVTGPLTISHFSASFGVAASDEALCGSIKRLGISQKLGKDYHGCKKQVLYFWLY